MQKVHAGDKVVDPALKCKDQAGRDGIPKPISVLHKYMSQPQRIIPPVLPRKEQGRASARRKTNQTKIANYATTIA